MLKKLFTVLATSALLLSLAACSNDAGQDTSFNNNATNSGPLTVRNDNGAFDRYHFDNRQHPGERDVNLDISSSFTSMSSDKYPHTKPIVVQHAKYKFVKASPEEVAELQKKIEQEMKSITGYLTPQQQQQAKQQAQQQAQQQAKTPAQQPQQQQEAPAPAQKPENNATAGISEYAQQVIDLTNQERAKGGLPALKADSQLSGVAQKKSQDMAQNNYFSHTSPTYGSPFDMMRDFGVTYKSAGENIAQGQKTPKEVVQAWMNSEGHRKNIMSDKFTHIGVGYVEDGNHWTQMFIGK